MKQDNPITKPRSVVFDEDYIIKTLENQENLTLLESMLVSST